MKTAARLLILFVLFTLQTKAQELYPLNEPASTLPKNTLAVRAMGMTYKEYTQTRNLAGLRLMYGLTPKLTVIAMANVSNHHNRQLPTDFPIHNTPEWGARYPYLFNGVYAYAKYRFLSIDRQNEHFRMAAYAEWSHMNTAHDEAEPTLTDDTKGYGAGFIATYLKNKLAVSLHTGFVIPTLYKGKVPDLEPSLPYAPAKVRYGNAFNYNFSVGYLLAPRTYKSYKQVNVNVYAEFAGKYYGDMQVYLENIHTGDEYYINTSNNKALIRNHYLEMYPALQCIFNSNLRVDVSVGFPLISRSYAHLYPVYHLQVQRYFYFNKKAKR